MEEIDTFDLFLPFSSKLTEISFIAVSLKNSVLKVLKNMATWNTMASIANSNWLEELSVADIITSGKWYDSKKLLHDSHSGFWYILEDLDNIILNETVI